MFEARETLKRILSGQYEENSVENYARLHRDLCFVLNLSIKCVTENYQLSSKITPSDACSSLWSGCVCWPSTPLNETAVISYLPEESNSSNDASDYMQLHCNASTGNWNPILMPMCGKPLSYEIDVNQSYPTSVTDVTPYNQLEITGGNLTQYKLYNDFSKGPTENDIREQWYDTLVSFVTVGNALSLASLLVALMLLFVLKRLHCTRIFIHMNLMASFVLRGLIWILHTVAFQGSDTAEFEAQNAAIPLAEKVFQQYNISDAQQLLQWRSELCSFAKDNTSFYMWCRVYYVVQNYSVTANYYWLLVEGIYLGLLLRATNSIRYHTKFMRMFLVLGWLCPWVSIIGSVVAKLSDENEYNGCWYEDKQSAYWWIIKIPIIFTLLVNFIIFILVIKVVGTKLKVNQRNSTEENREDYKWRLAKSTLALIHLLGIQYLFTAFFDLLNVENLTVLFVEKTFEIVFTSIEGLLVALIYCFFNGEVQAEFKRFWRGWKTEWELTVESRKKRSNSTSHRGLSNVHVTVSRKTSAGSTVSGRKNNSITLLGKFRVSSTPKSSHCSSNFDDLSEAAMLKQESLCNRVRISNASLNGSFESRNRKNEYRFSMPLYGHDAPTNSTVNGAVTEESALITRNNLNNKLNQLKAADELQLSENKSDIFLDPLNEDKADLKQ